MGIKASFPSFFSHLYFYFLYNFFQKNCFHECGVGGGWWGLCFNGVNGIVFFSFYCCDFSSVSF